MGLIDRLGAALNSELDPRVLQAQIEQLKERLSEVENAARVRQELLESVVNAAPVAIVLLDELGTIVFTNGEAREQLAPAPPGRGCFGPAPVQQIILNLVKDACEAGSPAQAIVLEAQAAPEGGHRIIVFDRGPSMSDEALENAMVPSFTTKAHGSEMGLTLCREIVDAHRGLLRIARREGGGIVVSLWLPPRQPLSASANRSRARLTLTRD